MSDTPRTDRAAFYPGLNDDYDDFSIDGTCVYATVARGLERENNALRQVGRLAEEIIVQRTDEIRHLERENAALRKDKERLDWIQENGPRVVNVLYHWQVWDDPEFRAIVDAARSKEAKQ